LRGLLCVSDVRPQIHFVLLFNRQGKIRLSQWLDVTSQKDRARIVRDIHATVVKRGASGSCVLVARFFVVFVFVFCFVFFFFFFFFFFFLPSFFRSKAIEHHRVQGQEGGVSEIRQFVFCLLRRRGRQRADCVGGDSHVIRISFVVSWVSFWI
jgi:hypothetical protein